MEAVPLCPLVLSLLEGRSRRTHEVADELRALGFADGAFAVAKETLTRLQGAQLVRARRGGHRDPVFMTTARGRRELGLQRLVLTRAARAAFVARCSLP